MKYDIIVIGGGITGITAAMYAKRAGANVIVLEKEVCGGQMLEAPLIENYPGFLPSSGEEIIRSIERQVEKLGLSVKCATEVTKIGERENGYYSVITDEQVYKAHSIIIATGASHKKLKGIDGDNVSYCPLCDGYFYRGTKVAVLGDGNSAMQYALYLSDICDKVIMCTLTDKLFGEEEVIQRVGKNSNIVQIKNVIAMGYKDNKLILNSTVDGEEMELNVGGVFIAIGQSPNTSFLDKKFISPNGYVINSDYETSRPGIFVAGDCRERKTPNQVVINAGEGAIVGMKAVEFVKKGLF